MLRNLFKGVTLFSTEVQKSSAKSTGSASTITHYREGQLVNRTSIILKKQEDIESYVIKTVQNYFRTTYKNGIFILIKVWAKLAVCLNTDWTLWMLSKLLCKLKRIWDTLFLLKPCPLSEMWVTTSLILSMFRPSREKIIKLPFLD